MYGLGSASVVSRISFRLQLCASILQQYTIINYIFIMTIINFLAYFPAKKISHLGIVEFKIKYILGILVSTAYMDIVVEFNPL